MPQAAARAAKSVSSRVGRSMTKNIVICCDGTRNEFGAENSNVVKLYKTLVCDASQIAYYHPGVGTMGARDALSPIGQWWTRVIGLAFGLSASRAPIVPTPG